MPRQGRQPAQLNQQPKRAKSSGKPSTRKRNSSTVAAPASDKATAGKKGRGAASRNAKDDQDEDSDAELDVYNYAARMKRPRGDVDPLARAPAARSKKQGKQRAQNQDGGGSDQDDNEELDSDADDDSEGGAGGAGFQVRGNEVVEFTGRKPAGFRLGLDSGDEGPFVDSDDDEEIDSDFVDDESDEEDLPRLKGKGAAATSGSSKGSKGNRRDVEVDLDEDEIDYDDEDGEGWMDLADVLDAGGYGSPDDDDDDAESRSDESAAEDEDEDMSSAASDGEDPDALNRLDSFVEGLDSKKRKSRGDGDSGDESAFKKKRAVLREWTEAYPEGEFTAVKPLDGSTDGKVDLDDLLSSFTDSKNPRLASIRKSLKPLAPVSESGSGGSGSKTKVTTTNSHLKAAGPLSAPLPGRLQDKVDREAAYEQTKAETDKWNEMVRRMKGESGIGAEGARHERLVLPLINGAGDVHREANAAELSAKFQPTNELEASIQSLLSTAQMSQADLQKQEQAALATLDPADLAARQAELRRQRDLMYRAERKAKRVAKIKSKAYRRIHRKAKEREAAGGPQMTLEDLAELDAIDGGNRAEEERARLEIQRAKERATLKHSGKGGRWAKKIDGLEGLEEERNASIRDMVARREELRKKIAGIEDGDEVDEFASDSDEGGASDSDAEGQDVDAIRRRAFDELAALDAKEAAAKANDPKLKGVLNMKFMRDAMACADKQVASEAEELRARLAQMDEAGQVVDDDDDAAVGSAPGAMSEQVQGNLGRMVFGPSGTSAKGSTGESAPQASAPTLSNASTTTKMSAPVSISSNGPRSRQRPSLSKPLASAADESNPWLALAEEESGAGKLSRKANKGDVSSAAAKTAAKADRVRAKQADSRAAERDDATVEIDVDAAAGLASERRKKAKGRKGEVPPLVGKALAAVPDGVMEEGASGDSDADLDEEDIDAQRGKGPAAFRQRELVKEAFANDDVVADFADEKRKEIERDAPREEDITLPGWGAWAGKGAKKAKNARKFTKKIDGVDATQRKDAKLNHVIISERKDKKAAKYMLKDLPFPYTSAAQHEHKLRTPMGPEWSTSTILRDQTIPAVLVKPGVTIRPVDRKTL